MTPEGELLARIVALLQAVMEHKAKARLFEQQFYPISNGASIIRLNKPDLESEEVQWLIREGLVQYTECAQNEQIPECSLRILDHQFARAEDIVWRYIETVKRVDGAESSLPLQTEGNYERDQRTDNEQGHQEPKRFRDTPEGTPDEGSRVGGSAPSQGFKGG